MMRPDVDPGAGELIVLLLVAILAWTLWGLAQFRDRREP